MSGSVAGRASIIWSAIVALAVIGGTLWLWPQTRQDAAVKAILAVAVVLGLGAVTAVWLGVLSRTQAAWVDVTAVVLLAASISWTGANSPSAGWFGHIVSHGSRTDRTVALTFDDGPNDSATLALDRILVDHGDTAAFFLVGKAVRARPDIAKALVQDGQLVGNHSYHHDSTRWLDPRYPELERDQRAIEQETGVCPAFYRPPHGQHTPFMTGLVDRKGMQVATWDVSVGDWKATNPDKLAAAVLRKVRPGSIIDLHDGLDGNVSVDRSVVVRALPAILTGLSQRGLRPVRLDTLLERPAYLTASRC